MRKMKESGIEWIGQIPTTWKITNISRIYNIKAGGDLDVDNYSDVSTEIHKYPIYTNKQNKYDAYGYTSVSRYKSNSITVTGRGDIGIAFYRECEYDAIIRLLVLTPKNKRMCKYHEYFINSVMNFKEGSSAIQQLSTQQLSPHKICLPFQNEQEEIVTYLDHKCTKIDETIEMENQVIEKLKAYKQSVITEAVTKGLDTNVPMKDSGIEWTEVIPEHWKAIKLKYEFRIKKNIAGKDGYDILSVTQKGIKIKDISNNKGQISMDYTKYQLVDINDYVMNHMDLLTGFVDCSKYVGITSPDYRVFSLINNKNSKEYFKYIFQSCYTNKIFYGLGQGVSGLGRWRLQTDKFLNFSLPIPQICEQDKIASYLNNKCLNIDRAIIQKENLIEKLTQYKKSLIYECVTGKQEV